MFVLGILTQLELSSLNYHELLFHLVNQLSFIVFHKK